MKPFDLEAAKRGEPVCTVNGNSVEILHISEDSNVFGECVIVGYVVGSLDGRKVLKYWNKDGRQPWSYLNLQMALKKEKVFLFVHTYPNKCSISHSSLNRVLLEASLRHLIKTCEGSSFSEIVEIEVEV